jgi:hypothetical protein
MRALILSCLLIVMLARTFADSYLIALEQKVATCTAILKGFVAEISPPQTKNPIDSAICKAKVLEVLKGPADLKEVEFRFVPYSSFPSAKLAGMVGKEYYVFLHEPPLPGRPSHERWVFEGPQGIRPIMDTYQEYRVVDTKVTTETYSRSNYVARILELVKNTRLKATKGQQ